MFPEPILHEWINQNALTVAPYGSSRKRSHARPLYAGNSASKASTCLDDKVPERKASSISLGAGETGAVGGAIPKRWLRRTSPRREAGMCANGWVAIRLLLGRIGGGLLTGVLYRGGEAIRGGSRTTRTLSRNRARRRAASRDDGVSSSFGTPG
jgi:hypothetical protein